MSLKHLESTIKREQERKDPRDIATRKTQVRALEMIMRENHS